MEDLILYIYEDAIWSQNHYHFYYLYSVKPWKKLGAFYPIENDDSILIFYLPTKLMSVYAFFILFNLSFIDLGISSNIFKVSSV